MESRKITIIETGYKCLKFPEIGRWSVSVQIDEHIFKNLDIEVDWAKQHGFYYENILDVKKYCNQFLKTGKSIYENKNIIKETEEFRRSLLSINEKIESESLKKQDRKTYLMKDNHNGLYKIGYSKNPKNREATLQSEKPSIKMVKIWNKDIELFLHKLYHNQRVRGEWFNLTKVQVKYICTHF